jgi:hypothetical protein
LLFLLALVCARVSSAVDETPVPAAAPGDKEAWLVTFGPVQIYWERFGHNAIWLREPAVGLDHTFNFGYFDFEQENFLLRFLRGQMLYFSVAQVAAREFDFYQKYNRSIRLQKINLSGRQYERLRDYLLNEIKPENRYYRYDYFLNNCSTRIRDAIDLALDGGLSSRTRKVPASLNFRDQTRRLTQERFWYYLGLELVLGYPTDRPVSRWDEMFIPMVLADEIAALSNLAVKPEDAMIVRDTVLYSSTAPQPGARPSSTWPRYLLPGLLIVGLAWLSGKFMPPVWLAGLCGAWVLICFTNGLVLAGLWLFTDHEVARLNANLLFFNPLVIVAFIPALHRMGAAVFAGGVVVAAALLLLPKHQYNLDVLVLLAPVNLAAALYLYRNKLAQK